MIVKSFLLKQDKLESIAALCDKDTIAVVRPQKKVEALFMSAIRKTIVEKKSADEEFKAIREYFIGLLPDPTYQETVETVQTMQKRREGQSRSGLPRQKSWR